MVFGMNKFFVLCVIFLCGVSVQAKAQSATLNKAKYLATIKVISEHKMDDADIEKDMDKLRSNKKFKQILNKMVEKLDNTRPNEAKNRRIMQILERAGKEIYDELK